MPPKINGRTHNILSGLQGGTTNQYYHLTSAQLSALFAYTGTAAQGDILYYNGSGWVLLTAGTSGYYLKTQGTGANPTWASVSALPSGTQGDILYYNGSAWVVLNAGTSGYYLKTQGAGANPVWAAVSATSIPPMRRYLEGELIQTVLMFYRVQSSCTISEARMTIGTRCSVSSGTGYVKVDVRKNGTATTDSIFSSDTPMQVASDATASNGVYTSTGTLDSGQTSCSAGDVLYVVVTEVGNGSGHMVTSGADLETIVSF